MAEEILIHWVNNIGAACGAPAGVRLAVHAHLVTCAQCVSLLKEDTVRRRQSVRHVMAAIARLEARLIPKT